jgi:hypothetical protein
MRLAAQNAVDLLEYGQAQKLSTLAQFWTTPFII